MVTRAPSLCLAVVRPPTTAEDAALAIAATYLARAGTYAASLLLSHAPTTHDGPLLEAVRDQVLGGTTL